jgi:hypothetical protein
MRSTGRAEAVLSNRTDGADSGRRAVKRPGCGILLADMRRVFLRPAVAAAYFTETGVTVPNKPSVSPFGPAVK